MNCTWVKSLWRRSCSAAVKLGSASQNSYGFHTRKQSKWPLNLQCAKFKNPQKQWNGYYCFGKKIRWNCKWRKKPEENMERAENERRARTISSSPFASSPSRRFPFLNLRVQRSGLNCSVNFTKFPKYPYANVQFPSCPLPLKACEPFLLFQSLAGLIFSRYHSSLFSLVF